MERRGDFLEVAGRKEGGEKDLELKQTKPKLTKTNKTPKHKRKPNCRTPLILGKQLQRFLNNC